MTHATKAIYGLTMMDTVRIKLVQGESPMYESLISWADACIVIKTKISLVVYMTKPTFKHLGNRQSL